MLFILDSLRETKMKPLVTGGLGFIDSNFVLQRLRDHPNDEMINLNKITYASNLLCYVGKLKS